LRGGHSCAEPLQGHIGAVGEVVELFLHGWAW
jgi:hypothetical protein